jgi:hypothetical protein
MTSVAFPLPFTSLQTISGQGRRSYVIGAMYTAGYSEKAARLTASCERLGLPYALHEVPSVHRSISPHGTEDFSYTKANFIHHLLATHKKPVLYVDADCEFVSEPTLISELVNSGCDFAIYNWLADEYTDALIPVELDDGAMVTPWSPGTQQAKSRFYRFSHGIDGFTMSQLMCSGPVQLYRNSWSARAFLSRWHQVVATFPGCADDECLMFAFNNIGRSSWLSWGLKVAWLPKAYARYPWWIYVEPVINHPEFPQPGSNFAAIQDMKGRRSIYPSRIEWRDPIRLFPRDCVVDTQEKMICELHDGRLVPIRPIDQKLWF